MQTKTSVPTTLPLLLLLLSSFSFATGSFPTSNIAIAPLHQAITFSRIKKNNEYINLAVLDYKNNEIHAVDLSAIEGSSQGDAIHIFNQYGYKRLVDQIRLLQKDKTLVINVTDLTVPVDLNKIHIATGANFKAHAEETEVIDQPFLFSKRVQPTSAFSHVVSSSVALDYEAEIAFVPLTDIEEYELPTYMGLMLSNDFSKRDELMHRVDINNIESAQGFVQGKSAPTLLPVGNLFVIPNNYKEFSQNLQLSLWVNKTRRQYASSKQMIWNIEDILHRIWQNRLNRWEYKGESVGLLVKPDHILARTLILSGTPEGTAFQGVPFSNKLTGITNWILSGFENSIQYHVVNAYLEQAEKEKRFLQTGDQVRIQADFLGVLDNHIESLNSDIMANN